MSANLQVTEGDLQLSEPFSLVIAKPANKTLPHGKTERPFDWIAKVDQLARQEDTAANYSASRWFAAAALEPAITHFGSADINTLHIEQFLAQNLFDNDRQDDALRLFNDILEKCAQVKANGKWNFRYGNVAKSVIGCKCEYAQGLYSKRRFGRAGGEFERAWKISQNLLGANEFTAKIKTRHGQAVKKRAEVLQAKAAISAAPVVATSTEGDKDKTQSGKAPSSPKVTIDKAPATNGNSSVSAGVAEDPKGKGKASPTGSQSPSRGPGKDAASKEPSNDKAALHKEGKVGKVRSSSQSDVGKSGSQDPPKGKTIGILAILRC